MWAVVKEVIKALLPSSPAAIAGMILAVLSALKLIELSIEGGLPPFAFYLAKYEDMVHALTGWTEPIIREWLAAFSNWIDWKPQLYPHWKHVLVLIGVYFYRVVKETAHFGLAHWLFSAVVGGVIAIAASIIAATEPLVSSDVWGNIIICVAPVVGVAVFDFVRDLRRAIWHRQREADFHHEVVKPFWLYLGEMTGYNARRVAVAAVIVVAGIPIIAAIPVVQIYVQSPAIVILGALVFALAIYRLRIGAINASRLRRGGESWADAFARAYSTRLGLSILSVFVWTFVSLVVGTGLSAFAL